MKSKIFLTAGFALSLLCAACSDDSNSLSASDAGKDDGKIAGSQNIETENGATFETKGNPSTYEYGITESYDGAVRMVDVVSATAEPTTPPAELLTNITAELTVYSQPPNGTIWTTGAIGQIF